MARTAVIPVGDTARDLEFVLSDADGPSDLNGVVVRLCLKDPETGATLEEDATVVNPSAPIGHVDRGRCRVPGALRAAWLSGQYRTEVEVEYVGGALDVWPTEEENTIVVRERRT